MKIELLCVGKIKEKFFREALAEYEKRLKRYCDLKTIQVTDEPVPENASDAINRQILETEGERLEKHIDPNDFVIALAINGKKFDSLKLAAFIEEKMNYSASKLVFVIGGSLGLSEDILKRSDLLLSFSDFTFPHQLMRVILLEQIYRSFRIIRGEPYHK